MITNFTPNMDFKKAIEEKLIQQNRLRAFLRERGIVFLNSNASDLADVAYTVFLGHQDSLLLQELIYSEKNYQKSTMFEIKPKIAVGEGEETFTEILQDEFQHYRSIGGQFNIEKIYVNENDNIFLDLSYEKQVKGKISLFSQKKKYLKVEISKINATNNYKVDIRQEDISDSKELLKFFSSIRGTEETSIFDIGHFSLKSLTKANRIAFFINIAKYSFKDWSLQDIIGISVNRGTEDEDEEDIEYSKDDDTTGTLSGITSAVLKGRALNTNKVVQMFLDQQFICTAMKYKYSCLKEAKSVVVDINFKDDDIKINIDKTYLKEESSDREIISPLPFDEQDEVIKLFQEAAYITYKNLMELQRQEVEDRQKEES